MWPIPTRDYHAGLKRNDVLTSATTGMNLEDLMLGELSQSQKDGECMTAFTCGPGGGTFTETESRWWAPGAGVGDGE